MTIRLEGRVARDASGDTATTSPTERRVLRSLYETLEESKLCSLATVSPAGRAHISTAYFAYSKSLAVYFLSHPGAQHCANLRRNPSAALSVFRSSQTWGGHDKGVQLFGEATPVEGRIRASAEAAYSRRFPLYGRWLSARTAGKLRAAAQLRSYSFYRFQPIRVKVFDEVAFGEAPFVSAAVRQN